MTKDNRQPATGAWPKRRNPGCYTRTGVR